jgi:uncharacterized protein YbaP (TraB family)
MAQMGFLARITYFAVALLCATSAPSSAASCVWKVTAPNGGIAYLGGSIHALRSTDYPLPAAYNHAFDASSRIVFEVDEKALNAASSTLVKAGEYPSGDSLKNHVDPRTYDYVRRVFALMKVPEAKFAKYRPWFLVLALQSGDSHGFSGDLGVEQFLLKRARAKAKPVSGLETTSEHAAVFSGLSDRQSEALLLYTFIPQENGAKMPWMEAWRNGDADRIARMMHETYREFPSFAERLLGARNRQWIPKIEGYLQSGQTYFVVAGAAHFGGADGVLALLRGRGYQITQL